MPHGSDSWPVGTRVVVRWPSSWAHGQTGTVHHHPAEWPRRCTVELDDGRRYLAYDIELRTAAPRGEVE